jgi:hypothetical protein
MKFQAIVLASFLVMPYAWTKNSEH